MIAPNKEAPRSALPTTKAKQRDYLDTIIDALVKGQLNRAILLAHMRVLRRQLHNRSPLEWPKRSAPPTATVRQKIIRLHGLGLSQQEVAHKLRISIGRVSETLRGKRR